MLTQLGQLSLLGSLCCCGEEGQLDQVDLAPSSAALTSVTVTETACYYDNVCVFKLLSSSGTGQGWSTTVRHCVLKGTRAIAH
jgi:hypothetical protein